MKRTAMEIRIAAILLLAAAPAMAQTPLGTAFTYQGRLLDGGAAANGTYDFEFKLFDVLENGSPLSSVRSDDLTTTNGLFTAEIDFGTRFDGERRWLEIGVRTGSSPEAAPFTILAPRREISAAPYSIHASGAASADNSDLLDGMDSTDFLNKAAHDADANGVVDQAEIALTLAADSVTSPAVADGEIQREHFASGLRNTLDASDSNPSNAVFVDDAGRVGIGTETPGGELTLEGGLFLHNSADPVHAGAITDNATTELDGASGIAVSGAFAYVAAFIDDGVEILNVSDPSNPVHAGSITDDATTELDGAFGIAVVGNLAYVTAFADDGVEILDVGDPYNRVHVGAITDDATTELDGPRNIVVVGRYAYVASSDDDGVEILDVSDPANPVHAGAIGDGAATLLDGAYGIAIAGNYAYVTGTIDDGVQVLDISDPSNPVAAGSFLDDTAAELNAPRDIAIQGNYAYVPSSTDSGLEIIDISDPYNPIHAGALADNPTTALFSPFGIAVSGRYAYVTSTTAADPGVEVVDISDPSNPLHAGVIRDAGAFELNGAWGIAISGRYAYVASQFDDGVEILELPGIDVPTGRIGAVVADRLDVLQSAAFGGALVVRGGLNAGANSMIAGDLTVSGGIAAPNLGTGTGTALVLDASGNIVQSTSSARFKESIEPANLDAEAILRLEPKSYAYKGSPERTIGYIAEQLDALGLGSLVNRDKAGRAHSIAYDKLPLYQTELLKRHEAELKALHSEKDAEIESLKERVRALESALGRLGALSPAPVR